MVSKDHFFEVIQEMEKAGLLQGVSTDTKQEIINNKMLEGVQYLPSSAHSTPSNPLQAQASLQKQKKTLPLVEFVRV